VKSLPFCGAYTAPSRVYHPRTKRDIVSYGFGSDGRRVGSRAAQARQFARADRLHRYRGVQRPRFQHQLQRDIRWIREED